MGVDAAASQQRDRGVGGIAGAAHAHEQHPLGLEQPRQPGPAELVGHSRKRLRLGQDIGLEACGVHGAAAISQRIPPTAA